jgi:hypothetical protein
MSLRILGRGSCPICNEHEGHCSNRKNHVGNVSMKRLGIGDMDQWQKGEVVFCGGYEMFGGMRFGITAMAKTTKGNIRDKDLISRHWILIQRQWHTTYVS